MSGLYLTGGRQKKRLVKGDEEWTAYEKALIIRLDPTRGTWEPCVEYESPLEARPNEDSSILFKGGHLEGNRLYICTSTEVLVYEVPRFKRVGYVSLPCFNDLHHVRPTSGGNLLVASTGLDMVVECTGHGEVLREWNVLGEDPWARFSRTVDYRKVPTTKPHRSHPNFVFQMEGQIWVTRFEQRDAICLTHPGEHIEIGIQRPHDGLRYGDRLFFTTVDGHVVVVDAKTRKIEAAVDLKAVGGDGDALLGWCRGVAVVDESRAWVGFTRIRKTVFLENISWVKHGLREVEKPTHIALYDVATRTCLEEIDVERYGLDILFGIFHVA